MQHLRRNRESAAQWQLLANKEGFVVQIEREGSHDDVVALTSCLLPKREARRNSALGSSFAGSLRCNNAIESTSHRLSGAFI